MGKLLADMIRYLKPFALIGAYAIVSFILSGGLAAVVPDTYYTAILVGWILSIAIVSKIPRMRYRSSRPA